MYREMKDSGVEWIGKIPVDWKIYRNKQIIDIISGNGFPESMQGKESGDYPFCKVSDINSDSDYIDSAKYYVSKDDVIAKRFNVVPEGSIIMSKIGAALLKNHRKINLVPCIIDNNVQALILKNGDDVRWALDLWKIIDSDWLQNYGTIPSINNNLLRNLKVPYVDISMQRKIADNVDKKVSEIDSILAQTKATIEDYKLLKQSIITEAVTKGLDKNVEMKESGIDWIGEIPKHWEIDKLSRLTKSYSGGTPSRTVKEYWENGNIPWMSSGEVNNGEIYETEEKITELGFQNSSAKMMPPETVVVALNGQGKTKGMSAILRINTTVNQSLVGFVCDKKKLDYRYLDYCFKSSYYFNRSVIAGGNKRDGIAAEDLRQSRIPVPGLIEQNYIANYLDNRCTYMDELIATKSKLIDQLEDYKKSLIYEYVTGKKEVIE